MLVFDIETGSRPEAELRPLCPPFDPTSVDGLALGEFDPASVKLGNLKDQAKIDAKIAEARAAHEAAAANAPQMLAAAEEAHWQSFVNRAALKAETGQVLAIGYWSNKAGAKIQGQGETLDERQLLTNFWQRYRACRSEGRRMIGFNIFRFDLPFMARRSWLLGVEVPDTLNDPSGRYFDRVFVDLMTRWQCGVYQESIGLNAMAQYFGVGGKPDGICGADFGRLWIEDRETAIAYLKNDLEITGGCAARMGIV
jgi:hypothetical protein